MKITDKLNDIINEIIVSFFGNSRLDRYVLNTAKIILERLHHRLSKFDRSVFLNLKPIYYFFWRLYGLVFYLETIGDSWIMT